MIKQLKKYDVQTTPFIATKDWHLLNVQHQDLVLLEPYSSSVLIPDTYISLEFIDYSFGNPYGVLNTDCNVALEQQDYNPVLYEEGISGSGLFFPSDPQNPSGTYKRLVYHQILRAFYNSYHNPLKIFGLEKFDFQTSGMQRYLSNYFRIFTLPQQKFGDKIQPGTVLFVDNSFDDNYTVVDDCQGNLIASPNLFSRTQEVRHFENIVNEGSSVFFCHDAITDIPTPTGPFEMSANLTASMATYVLGACQVAPFTMSLWWTDPFPNEMGFYLYMSVLDVNGGTWTPFSYIASVGENVTSYEFHYPLPMVTASFYAVAYNPLGVSDPSTTATVMITCSHWAPAPINLMVVSSSALLTWETASGATQDSFEIWKSIDHGAWVDYTSTPDPNLTYEDVTVYKGHTYTYRVAAVTGTGAGDFSNEASITFNPDAPAPPILDPIVSGSAQATWHSQSNDQDYFSFEKSTNGIAYSEIATTIATVENYEDFDVTSTLAGEQYWYRVAAVNAWGTSSWSNVEDITFTVYPPSTPTLLSVLSSSATLLWVPGGINQDYFPVQKSTNGADFYEITTTPDGLVNYQDTDVSSSIAGNTYWYRVGAVNHWASSSFSNVISITFAYTPPVPPLPPILDPIISGSSLVYWHSQSNDQDFFAVERSTNGVNYSEITTTAWSVETTIDTNVVSSEAGNTYWYRVAAVNTDGTSSYSNVENITFQYSPPVPVTCQSGTFPPAIVTSSIPPYIPVELDDPWPIPEFAGIPLKGNATLNVAFTNYSSHSFTYDWSFGDGGTSTDVNPSYAYTVPGKYTVALTATGYKDRKATKTRNEYVWVTTAPGGGVVPTASFYAVPVAGLAPLTVQFYNESDNALTYYWTFGDGGNSTALSPSYQYAAPGTYTVSLTAYNGVLNDTMTRTDYIIVVTSGPVADFEADPVYGEEPLTVDFFNYSENADSYHWTFGDGGESTEFEPTYTYDAPGLYTVALTASSASIDDTMTRMDYIEVTPWTASCLAWWTMMFGPPHNSVDSVQGIVTEPDLNYMIPYMRSQANDQNQWIMGDAMRMYCEGESCEVVTYDPRLATSVHGVTVAAWIRPEDINWRSTNELNIAYHYTMGANRIIMHIYREQVGGQGSTYWRARFYKNTYPPLATIEVLDPSNSWHFVYMRYDALNGTFTFDMDQMGVGASANVGILPTGSISFELMQWGGAGADSWPFENGKIAGTFDEIAVYNGPLSANQLDFIYNSSSGSTWPVTLPEPV